MKLHTTHTTSEIKLEENLSARYPKSLVKLRKIPKRYGGFNAIELSLVLGVIALAIVGIIRIMSDNSNKVSSNQMVNDVSGLVSNIQNAYSSSTTGYSQLTTQALIDGKMVPQDLKIPSTDDSIQSQFQGGTVTAVGDTAGENFTITYDKVPTAICNSAINTLGSSSFLSIKINDVTVYDSNLALDGTAVAAACKHEDGIATIEFTAS